MQHGNHQWLCELWHHKVHNVLFKTIRQATCEIHWSAAVSAICVDGVLKASVAFEVVVCLTPWSATMNCEVARKRGLDDAYLCFSSRTWYHIRHKHFLSIQCNGNVATLRYYQASCQRAKIHYLHICWTGMTTWTDIAVMPAGGLK